MAVFTETMPHHETGEYREGAFCFVHGKPINGETAAVWLERFRGAVIADRERNMYDDSDFYAVVWNAETGRIEDVEYGSTRYGNRGYTKVDATDEVKAAARAWRDAEVARIDTERAAIERAETEATATETDLTPEMVTRLKGVYGGNDWRTDACFTLLRTRAANRFRSAFRKGLADRVFDWLHTESPAYRTPLSDRQMECLIPRRFAGSVF